MAHELPVYDSLAPDWMLGVEFNQWCVVIGGELEGGGLLLNHVHGLDLTLSEVQYRVTRT